MIDIIRYIDQGSDEWFDYRRGSVGASSISKIITSTGKPSTQRQDYMYKLAAEKITGKTAESHKNQNMINGTEYEDQTRMRFMLQTNKTVEEVGLIIPKLKLGWHISPDGIIQNEEAGLEIKSVLSATQCKYLDKGKLPTEYILQCQMSLFVTGWNKWYFCSASCESIELPILIIEVNRDEKLIANIEKELTSFVNDLYELTSKIMSIR